MNTIGKLLSSYTPLAPFSYLGLLKTSIQTQVVELTLFAIQNSGSTVTGYLPSSCNNAYFVDGLRNSEFGLNSSWSAAEFAV